MITCTFENGGKGSLRHVVVNAIIIKDNKILLAKRSEKIKEGGKWCLAGGFMNRDEGLAEALGREVFEETGYKIKSAYLFTIIDIPKRRGSDWQNVDFLYVCEAGEKEGSLDWETSEIKWFDLDNLPSQEEIAFDHFQVINLYLENKNKTPLEVLRY